MVLIWHRGSFLHPIIDYLRLLERVSLGKTMIVSLGATVGVSFLSFVLSCSICSCRLTIGVTVRCFLPHAKQKINKRIIGNNLFIALLFKC